MTESLPITTPPRRRQDPVYHPASTMQFVNAMHSSESCKNTSNVIRKLEPFHHALLDSGSQSAKSSPLPHRRLDKLEGCIRDKPSPMSLRRRPEPDDACSSSESSPAAFRKFGTGCACAHQDSPMLGRRLTVTSQHHLQQHHLQEQPMPVRRFTDCGCSSGGVSAISSPMMRRRVESDCSCASSVSRKPVKSEVSTECACAAAVSPLLGRKNNVYSSPAKSVLGEPGCFSSPVHQRPDQYAGYVSPAKSVIGEPGVFASPARSLCISPCDENAESEVQLQPDQTVVSGWLKFRDNKRKVVTALEKVHKKNNLKGRAKIPLGHAVLITLWTLANQDSFRAIGNLFGIGASHAREVFMDVCNLLYRISPEFITFPTKVNANLAAQKFNSLSYSTFPNVIGCVDATDINIPGPKSDNSYYNRKGNHSIKLQAVCDANMSFTDVYVGWPGSVHDARVWQNSPIYNKITTQENFIRKGYHILGDSAYMLDEFLMKPYTDNGHLTPAQKKFNFQHAKKRVVIEQAFGRLKGMWRRLKFLNVLNLKDVKYIVVNACVLHNIGLLHRVKFDDHVTDSDNGGDLETDDEDSITVGSARRKRANEKRNNIAANIK